MIVITGGAGFIGSVLAWKFNSIGRKDLILVDQHAKNSLKWKNVEKRQFEDYLEYDDFITKLERGIFSNRVHTIFHMGACSDTTEKNAEFLKTNNLEYSQRITRWCLDNKAYLCYASSAATYGDGSMGFSDQDKLTHKLSALNLYGQSKLDFDIWALRNGFEKKITGFRFFNVYGPNEYHKGHMRSLVDKGYEQISTTGKLKLFKSYKPEYVDGGQLRDFVYVKDVVDVMLWFYHEPHIKGIFNLGTGRAQSWNDLAQALFKAMNRASNVEYVDMPENIRGQYQYYTQADLLKFRSTGCPIEFQDVRAGVTDYVTRHLSLADPYL